MSKWRVVVGGEATRSALISPAVAIDIAICIGHDLWKYCIRFTTIEIIVDMIKRRRNTVDIWTGAIFSGNDTSILLLLVLLRLLLLLLVQLLLFK